MPSGNGHRAQSRFDWSLPATLFPPPCDKSQRARKYGVSGSHSTGAAVCRGRSGHGSVMQEVLASGCRRHGRLNLSLPARRARRTTSHDTTEAYGAGRLDREDGFDAGQFPILGAGLDHLPDGRKTARLFQCNTSPSSIYCFVCCIRRAAQFLRHERSHRSGSCDERRASRPLAGNGAYPQMLRGSRAVRIDESPRST